MKRAAETTRQGVTLFTAIAILVGLQVLIQLYLLAIALDASASVAIAAAVASGALFVVNLGLLAYVVGYDKRARRTSRGS